MNIDCVRPGVAVVKAPARPIREGPMIHIDQILADYAAVHEHKLFITGAGINMVLATPTAETYSVTFGVGILLQVPKEDANRNHRLLVALTDTSGQLVTLVDNRADARVQPEDQGKIVADFDLRPGPGMNDEDEIIYPLGFQFYNLQLPHAGPYTIRSEVDGIELSYSRFRVLARDPKVPARLALADP